MRNHSDPSLQIKREDARSERLKILLSAYACEPGKGSEPEVGWQWAAHLSALCEATVLTRANNGPSITAEVNRRPALDKLHFLYQDLGSAAIRAKRSFGLHRPYYSLWQHSARKIINKEASGFDLAHHLTFASFRYATAIQGVKCPTIWGPVGGAEAIPMHLLPWSYPGSLAHELARNSSNALETLLSRFRNRRWKSYSRILASTRETVTLFKAHGIEATLFPTIGISRDQLPVPKAYSRTAGGELRLLFVGNLLYLKGIHLALHALAHSKAPARFTIVGEGPFRVECQKICSDLQIASRVDFVGKVPKAEIPELLTKHDVFVFPSLHDSGGIALLEAMAAGLPAIVLDCGGPAVALEDDCGFKVPVLCRDQIIAKIAEAIDFYASRPEKLAEHGMRARQRVVDHYLWEQKALQMLAIYKETINAAS